MLSRRSLLRSGAGLSTFAVLTTLAACGEDSSTGAGSTPTGSATPEVGAFPRTVEHELGSTEIAAAPTRVVCGTDGGELCSLLALGVRPVGYGQRNDPPPAWLGDLTEGLDSYDLSSGETSYEALAAWAPDVILVQNGFGTEETLPRFTDIAPTVVTSFIDWRDNLRQVAAAVGLDDAAADLERRTDEAVAAIADRLAADLGEQVEGLQVQAVCSFTDGSIYAFNADSPLGKLSEALGLAPLPASTAEGEAINQISAEELDVLDGDVLLMITFDEESSGNEELKSGRLYQSLEVVRAGRVIEVGPGDADALYFDTVLNVESNAALIEGYVRQTLA